MSYRFNQGKNKGTLGRPLHMFLAGLPDGLFSNQKSQFGKNFYGFRLENVDVFYTIWNILRIFFIFCDHSVHFVFIWYIFSIFGIMDQEKSGNPGS
jgi:hypothetical protein